jgi:hypothetical protein
MWDLIFLLMYFFNSKKKVPPLIIWGQFWLTIKWAIYHKNSHNKCKKQRLEITSHRYECNFLFNFFIDNSIMTN